MINMNFLIETIKANTFLPERQNISEDFLFAVDHCFTIKGQGTILTGTVLSGCIKINDVRFDFLKPILSLNYIFFCIHFSF
jgi:selenocysteine-specific elongation factor